MIGKTCLGGSHEQDVITRAREAGLMRGSAHNTLAAVADDCVTELFPRYKSNATTGVALLVLLFIDDANLFGRDPFALAEQLANLLAGLDDVHAARIIRSKLLRVTLVRDSQLSAALGTTASENLATVLGLHTGTEAVHLGTMPLIGLISALHRILLVYIKHNGG